MIAEQLKNPLIYITAGILIFNLTQRKHIEHGEKKRRGTLYLAGAVLFLYAAAALISRFRLGDAYLIPVFAGVALLILFKRKYFFPFSKNCVNCGKKLSLKKILYYDAPLCEECDQETGGQTQKE